MFSKIINGQSKTITGAAIIIGGATLISRLVGLARDRIFAHSFGAGQVMDAYYAAFKIPDLVYNLLILGALTAGFIPVFIKIYEKDENKQAAWKFVNNIINIIGVAIIALCGLGIIFAPHLSSIIAPGFGEEAKNFTAQFTRIMFLSPILLGFSMTFGGVLQSLRRFAAYSLAPIFYNLGIIAGTVILFPIIGATGLAWGVVLGALLHFILQAYAARKAGFRWRWEFNLKDKETWLVGKLMIPRALGLALNQVSIFVVTILASLLPSGSVSVYNFANNLQAVPIGIIGIPFALAVFPALSSAAAENNKEKFIQNLSSTTRQILFLVIPCSILILLLRAQIVRVVLGSGAFDWNATIATADALALFSLSLFSQSLIPLFARAFYSISNTKTPFIIGMIAELIGIIAALILMKPLGVAGLALAFSCASIINFSILTIALRQTLKGMDEENLLNFIFRVIIAGIVMAIIVQILKYPLAAIFNQQYLWGILGQGFIAGSAGLVIYGFLCYILKVPEFMQFKDSFKKKWLRLKNVQPAEIMEGKE
ncbi:MAG: murein biosynthesis integral membrane protein MurJ [Patescibacteria group bacterium]